MSKQKSTASATVEFVDLDNKRAKIRDSNDLIGSASSIINYDPTKQIEALEKAGYILVDNPFTSADEVPTFGAKSKYTITFKHGHEIVTADNLKHGVKREDLEKTGQQIVHYAGVGSRTPRDNVATLKFERILVFDKVTGKQIEDKGWKKAEQSYPVIGIPSIMGYAPDKSYVGGEKVKADNPNREYTINYHLNNHHSVFKRPAAQIKYLDLDNDNARVADSEEIKGKANTPINYSTASALKRLAKNGYEVVSNEYDGEAQFFDNNVGTTQTFIVTLRHKKIEVNQEHPNQSIDESQYHQVSKRVIKFSGAGQATPKAITQTINWYRSVTLDAVTDKLVEYGQYTTNWKPEKPEYESVKVPVVPSYHSLTKTVSESEATLDNQLKQIVYHANGHIIAVDEDGNQIATENQFVTYKNDPTKVKTTVKIPELEEYEPDTKSIRVTNPAEDIKVKYHRIHDYVAVNKNHPSDDVNPGYYERVSTAVAHYEGAGKKTPDDSVQIAHWSRTVTFDKIAQEIVEDGKYTTEWKADCDKFEEVKVPALDGYVASTGLVSSHEVGQHNMVATITYKPVGKIIPVDKSGKAIPDSQPVPYTVDPYDASQVLMDEKTPAIKGYLTHQDEVIIKDPTADTKVEYYLKPEYIKVNSQHPYKGVDPRQYDLTVKFIVNYVGAGDDTPQATEQVAHWTRDITVNKVDDQIIVGGKFDTDWQVDRQQYQNVIVPAVDGYHADKALIPAGPVDQNDHDISVRYRKNGSVIAVDSDGKQLDEISYLTDPRDASKVLDQQVVPRIKEYQPEKLVVKVTKPEQSTIVKYTSFQEIAQQQAEDEASKEMKHKPTIVIPKIKKSSEHNTSLSNIEAYADKLKSMLNQNGELNYV